MQNINTNTNSYYSPVNRAPRPAKRRRYLPGLFALLIIAAGAAFAWHLAAPHKSAAESRSSVKPASEAEQQQAISAMGNNINAVLASQSGVDISVTVTNLRTSQTQSYGPAVPYEAASVAKLITAADYLHGVEAGQQSLQTQLEDGHTASYDLRQMIVVSDNNAWQSLTDQLGLAQLGAYAGSVGISDYNLNDNTLETSDIARLLQKLYDGQLLNKNHTNLLLGYMKIANEAGFIPPAVPKDVPVYHKAGVLEDRIHDAAIIDAPNNPVALVIFTNGHGTYDTAARTQAIQSITKAVLAAYDIR